MTTQCARRVETGGRPTTLPTHPALEGPMSPTPTNPADLLREAADRAREIGDPLHTALALWLSCEQRMAEFAHLWTEREACGWCDTPAAGHALAVARQLLGTTTGQPATAPWPPTGVERPDHELYTLLRKAGLTPEAAQQEIDTYTRAIRTQQAPAVDRAAVLNEAADEADRAGGLYAGRGDHDRAGAAFALMETFRRKADEAEYVATPCSAGACEPGGEPCTTHERLMAHAEGDHELCDHKAAEAQQPTPAVTEKTTAPGGFVTRVCRNCSRTITWVSDGSWTHEPHNRDGGHAAVPYPLPDGCHRPAPTEETK
ncbi:hypothetical protein ACFWXI_14595 [[Kitasatospora] papulosa]|uniref:hypothetical protein n=1 Tax=[Kitasatospora] papulosa TaxID=1464011 RepID=UPI00368DDF02